MFTKFDITTLKYNRHKRDLLYALNKIKNSELCAYIDEIILYGSLARGDASYDSDIDIVLSLKDSARNLEDYSRVIRSLKSSVESGELDSTDVDLKIFCGSGWKCSSDVFCILVRRDGKLL